jgi:hypothetical protein
MGCDIHVMLANSFHAMVAQTVDSTRELTMGMVIREVWPRCKSPMHKKTGPTRGLHQLGLKPAGHLAPSVKSNCCFLKA